MEYYIQEDLVSRQGKMYDNSNKLHPNSSYQH